MSLELRLALLSAFTVQYIYWVMKKFLQNHDSDGRNCLPSPAIVLETRSTEYSGMTDWHKIVGQHSDSLRKTAWRLLGNHADAADCLQEAFLGALDISRRKRVRNWHGLLHWLVVRRAMDCLRQRVRQRVNDETWHKELAASMMFRPNPGPAQQVETMELVNRLRRALAELPPLQAQVVCLRYLSDLSYRAIGRALDLNIRTVGSILHRGRARLRILLGESTDEKELRCEHET